jgi:hypothetical protein
VVLETGPVGVDLRVADVVAAEVITVTDMIEEGTRPDLMEVMAEEEHQQRMRVERRGS